MIICSRCKAPIRDGSCPLCERKGGFVEASEKDAVYLTTVEAIFSNAVDDLLKDNGIIPLKRNVKGAATTVYIGTVCEQTDFYVYPADYDAAIELINAFNTATEEDLDEEGE